MVNDNENNDNWEPDGCLAVPPGYIRSMGDKWFYNCADNPIFQYDEEEEQEDGTLIYRGVKILLPILVTRVNSQIINGFNVFINLEQKLLENLQNVEKIIITDECVTFDVTEEDSCWEVNIDVFHILH